MVENEKFVFSNNFKEFFNIQLPKWIKSVILAVNFEEKKEYIIEDGKVNPVAYDSTGSILRNTNWGDGCH
jgi:hypothetical protein